MKNLPSLRQLQYFLAVMQTESFSAAAAACHVTQPTLSAGIRDLEAVLGVKLFDRTSRRVAPTRAGIDLGQASADIIARTEDMMDRARSSQKPLCGVLRVGVIPTIAPYLLPRVMPALQSAYPKLELEIKEDQTARILTLLDQRQIDIALMAFPFETPQAEQMILWDEPFFLVRSEKNKGDSKPVSINDLEHKDILLLDDGHCLRDHVISACRLSESALRRAFGATSLQTLTQFVQNGYGVTLLPAMAVDPENPPPGLVIGRFKNPAPSRQIGLCWRKGHPRAPEFHLFGEFIVKAAHPR